jgi:hypothetical protein
MGMFRNYGGRWDGRRLGVEIKRSDFDPAKIPQTITYWKQIRYWHEQLTCMHRINNNGGVAFWVRDPAELANALRKILDGASVTIDDHGFCWIET